MKRTSITLLCLGLLLSGCFHYRSVDTSSPTPTVSQRTVRTSNGGATTTTTVTR